MKSNSIVIPNMMIIAICIAPLSLLLIHSDPSITVLLTLPSLSLSLSNLSNLFSLPLYLCIALSFSDSGWSNVDIPAVNCSWPSNCRLMARWKGKSRKKLNRKLELSAEPRDTHSEALHLCRCHSLCPSAAPGTDLCAPVIAARFGLLRCAFWRRRSQRFYWPHSQWYLWPAKIGSMSVYICLYVYRLLYIRPGAFRARASAIFD